MFVYYGPGFPLTYADKGFIQFKGDEELIKDSIKQILGTRLGERVMNPLFGSRLHQLIHEPNDNVLTDMARLYVEEALGTWEPRISIENIEVVTEPDTHTAYIVIDFIIVKIGKSSRLIYELPRMF